MDAKEINRELIKELLSEIGQKTAAAKIGINNTTLSTYLNSDVNRISLKRSEEIINQLIGYRTINNMNPIICACCKNKAEYSARFTYQNMTLNVGACEKHSKALNLFAICIDNEYDISQVTKYVNSIDLFLKENIEEYQEAIVEGEEIDIDENNIRWITELLTMTDIIYSERLFKAWLGVKAS